MGNRSPGKNRVTSLVEKEAGSDIISLSNNTPCEVTITVKITDLENAEVNVPLPHTAVIPPGKKIRAAAVSPVEPSKPLTYKYQFQWKYGSSRTVADQRISYGLPYKPGRSYMVMQAYNGDFTHMGYLRYAIDWKMPIGTEICAVRSGTVIEVCDIYDGGGTTEYYLRRANYMLIRHPDGTIAEYGHLLKGRKIHHRTAGAGGRSHCPVGKRGIFAGTPPAFFRIHPVGWDAGENHTCPVQDKDL